jgi:predicted amidohydrolase YtcJ
MLAGADSPIRWSVYAWGYPAKSMRVPGLEGARASSARGNVRVAGVKWMLDGTPIERGARLRAPYADKPGWRGVSNFTDAELREILLDALARTNQTALHVVGNAEIERLFAAMEALAPTERWRPKRLRIEHGEGLEPDLIPRAEKLGVIVVQNPLHLEPLPAEAGREMMESRMGRQRMATNQPLRSLLAAGVPLALGSDAGGDAASPYLNMMLATQHRLNPKEALTREQALLAYTSGGAMAEGQESIRGMIKAGMTADMAMLSQDVLTAPLERLPATVSLLTVIGGRVVHEARQSEPEGKADRTKRP